MRSRSSSPHDALASGERSTRRGLLGSIKSERHWPLIAGLHQAVIASAPTNDDFLHLVMARQIMAGDWPAGTSSTCGLGLMSG